MFERFPDNLVGYVIDSMCLAAVLEFSCRVANRNLLKTDLLIFYICIYFMKYNYVI